MYNSVGEGSKTSFIVQSHVGFLKKNISACEYMYLKRKKCTKLNRIMGHFPFLLCIFSELFEFFK